jgi:hypothetical protein
MENKSKNKEIHFVLSDKQQKRFDAWGKHLKAIFGEWGLLTWTYTGNGIGESITVTSSNAPEHPLDLTDIDSW